MRLTLSRLAAPPGDLLLVSDDQDRLLGSDYATHEARLHRLLQRRIGVQELHAGPPPAAIARALVAYFDGVLTAIDEVPVVLNGTDFQNRAWAALRQIPPGQTRSYGEQARQLGLANGARAIGSANHSNPCNLILPCHRLVAADGALTGYAGGLARKRWLLDHESRYAARTGI